MTIYKTTREELERDCTVHYVRVRGPGGQHRNRRNTGVRLVHAPSGVVVLATERRSRLRNHEIAFQRLADRLQDMNKAAERARTPRRIRRIPRSVKKRRRKEKSKRSQLKALRQRPQVD